MYAEERIDTYTAGKVLRGALAGCLAARTRDHHLLASIVGLSKYRSAQRERQ
jgi:hypothetical protein